MKNIIFSLSFPLMTFSAAAQKMPVVDVPETVEVTNESAVLTASPIKGYLGGYIPQRLNTFGVAACGSLKPGSVRVVFQGRTLEEGKDYVADYQWSKVGIGPRPSVKPGDTVSLNYAYRLRRIDSEVLNPDGSHRLVKGKSNLNVPEAPALAAGQTRLANLFVDYDCDGTNPVRLPLKVTAAEATTASTCGKIPRTLAKINAGQPVKIVCWGDSVTAGGDATPGNAYPAVFARLLKERFPQGNIEVKVVAVSGSSSTNWLWPKEYPAAGCDWDLVAKEKPDLVTLEFVNDVGLTSKAALFNHYGEILKRVRGIHAELIIVTPHFTKFAEDAGELANGQEGRPYVKFVKEFATAHQLGLADASARWEHLADEGIPYLTLLPNSVNHPNDFGHHLFAEELLKNFTDCPATAAPRAAESRGGQWIRRHPFQIAAFVEGATRNYTNMGFTSLINYYSPDDSTPLTTNLLKFTVANDLPWIGFFRWTDKSDNPKFIGDFAEKRKTYPGNIGILIGDENLDTDFKKLSPVMDEIRTIAPDALVSHCGRGIDIQVDYVEPGKYEAYVDQLVNVLKPDVINFNMYPFYRQAGNHGLAIHFFRNLEIITTTARTAGIPCFNWAQGFAFQETDKWPHHAPSESELRMQAFVSLAYGVKGLFYWTYSSHYHPYGETIIDQDGNFSSVGTQLQGIIPELKNLGEITKNLNDRGAYYVPARHYDPKSQKWETHIPFQVKLFSPSAMPTIKTVSVSDAVWGFLLGDFYDDHATEYVMVVNTNFGYKKTAEETAGNISLRFDEKVISLERLNRKTGKFETVPLSNHQLNHYRLPGGTGDLFKINR